MARHTPMHESHAGMSGKKKSRRRRKKGSSRPNPAIATVTLNPGDVPSDEELEAEAAAIGKMDEKTQKKFEKAKKDGMDMASLQHMTVSKLLKIAKDDGIEDASQLK